MKTWIQIGAVVAFLLSFAAVLLFGVMAGIYLVGVAIFLAVMGKR